MGKIIRPKAEEPDDNDYVKFKNFLGFFVKQAEENKKNEKVHNTVMNKKGTDKKNEEGDFIYEDDPKFVDTYGVKYGFSNGFNKIAGLDFTIRFSLGEKMKINYNNKNYNLVNSIYINIEQFNIIGKFENQQITHLRNFIKVDIENKSYGKTRSYTGIARVLCEERNLTEGFQFHKIEDLGLDDNAPNETLKKMLREYLKSYNELFELAENSVERYNKS